MQVGTRVFIPFCVYAWCSILYMTNAVVDERLENFWHVDEDLYLNTAVMRLIILFFGFLFGSIEVI